MARNYPDEPNDGHVVPDVNTWDKNFLNAGYTQVVQKRGGSAKTARLDMNLLNGKFDEVYNAGGIYNFTSHPQWLDFGPDKFYESISRTSPSATTSGTCRWVHSTRSRLCTTPRK